MKSTLFKLVVSSIIHINVLKRCGSGTNKHFCNNHQPVHKITLEFNPELVKSFDDLFMSTGKQANDGEKLVYTGLSSQIWMQNALGQSAKYLFDSDINKLGYSVVVSIRKEFLNFLRINGILSCKHAMEADLRIHDSTKTENDDLNVLCLVNTFNVCLPGCHRLH